MAFANSPPSLPVPDHNSIAVHPRCLRSDQLRELRRGSLHFDVNFRTFVPARETTRRKTTNQSQPHLPDHLPHHLQLFGDFIVLREPGGGWCWMFDHHIR